MSFEIDAYFITDENVRIVGVSLLARHDAPSEAFVRRFFDGLSYHQSDILFADGEIIFKLNDEMAFSVKAPDGDIKLLQALLGEERTFFEVRKDGSSLTTGFKIMPAGYQGREIRHRCQTDISATRR